MVSARLRAYQRRVTPLLQYHGAALWSAGRVDLVDIDEDCLEATVKDERTWFVRIDDHDRPDDATFSCTCKVFASLAACAHIWGAVLESEELLAEVERQEAQHAAGRAGSTVPAVTSRSSLRVQASRGPRTTQPDWRRRLQAVVRAPAEDLAVPQLEYHITPAGMASADPALGLAVVVRARYAKKNGQLGAPRATTLPSHVLALLPLADRTLLAMWERDRRASRYGYYGYRQGEMRLGESWLVSDDAVAVVMPCLAATGRVYLAPPSTTELAAPKVDFDIEVPFHFEVAFEPASRSGASARLHGTLRRGEESLSIDGLGPLREHGFAFVGHRVVRVDCAGAHALAAELTTRGAIEVPAADADEMLTTLARVPGARQFLAAAIEHVPHLRPIGVLSLLLPATASAPVTATLQFDYAGASIPAADDSPLVEEGDAVRRRHFAAERQLAEHVLAAGLRPQAGGQVGKYECERGQVAQITATLCAAGLRVLAEGRRLRTFTNGSGKVRSQLDWLEVDGAVQFDGHLAHLPELLRRKVTPDGFVELGDGSFGLLPQSWVRRIEALRLLGGEFDGQVVRLPNSQALLLDAMLEARDSEGFEVDRKFGQVRKRLRAFRSIAPAVEPPSFRGELRPYQRQGLGWLQFLREFELGGCLADDMGLGKTVQVLAHLAAEHARRTRKSRPSLLVAPRSVLPNWLAEAARFAPDLRVLDFSQADRWQATSAEQLGKYDLVLVTYAIVRADAVKFEEHGLRFHYAILDESQVAKNGESLTSKAVRLVRSAHRLSLTGTPVENHLGELWSLFEFLNPGMLGRLPAFRSLFAKDLTDEAMAQHRELVQRALRPVLLRRTKAQVLTDLPDKVEQTLWCDLEPPQRRRYDELRLHFRNRLLQKGGELNQQQRFVVLEALLRLRQAACHEGLLEPGQRDASSAKFDVLLPRLEELAAEGHKVLVFSQFTTLLDLVEPALTQRGIPFERLDGQTKDREARVQRFQTDPACAVFLISLKAGGFGLNLTAADYVFVLDPWWNPAAEMQAIDRAHRIGQKRTVHAYRLVCRGTVEERVLELQAQKKALCEALLGNDRSLLQDMTRGDLELLLG